MPRLSDPHRTPHPATGHRPFTASAPTPPPSGTAHAPEPRPSAPLASKVRAHLADAHARLAETATARTPAGRYVAAHMAALRAAAAVLAARPRPMEGRRRRLQSAWELLPQAEPQLADWAVYFAASAAKRAAAEAGLVRTVSAADADELAIQADTFVTLVETLLGVPHRHAPQPHIPLAG
ncbi:hypothetical protein SAMN05421505_108190 [Sinosporangium album]|uniref:SAV-6107-like HEPN domain-containing protein n=1 Tax=Sinosporangium album TaxID=504805 RepID=A0A1G7XHE7_9ACTN|nr:SAV_6107 family HEPN domain-containing protein [Sinosporangium album]SDG83481.1 hypothetical protein SAMN05421505_108190 [Sinosporangium album]